MTVILIMAGALRTVPKERVKKLDELEISGRIRTDKTNALL